MTEAARKLGITNRAIRRLIRDGDLPAQQAVLRAPYQIQASDLRCERITAALARRGGPGRKETPLQPSLFSDT
jgi:excisionase family DNA binding protein